MAAIFIYESLSAGDFPPPIAPSLRREGEAMFRAIVEDFSRIADVRVVTLDGRTTKRAFQRLASKADYSLIIAPELHGILQTRCAWVIQAGGRLLGPTLQAVKLTSDKRTLARWLERHNIPTPPVFSPPLTKGGRRVVIKPRWGAGSQGVRLLHRPISVKQARDELIVQPFIPGLAASIAWLIGPVQKLPLLPATQKLSSDGRFRYLGGRIPLPPSLRTRAIELTRRAIDVVPGLHGYVGFDLVLGPKGDHIIEINPRLTTSYLGLRRLARTNLAEAMLRVAQGKRIAPLRWKRGSIEFDSAGK